MPQNNWRGWMCVVGRCLALFMTNYGNYKSFGIFMPFFIHELNTSAGAAGAGTALFAGLVFMLGRYTLIHGIGALLKFLDPLISSINVFCVCLFARSGVCSWCPFCYFVYTSAILATCQVARPSPFVHFLFRIWYLYSFVTRPEKENHVVYRSCNL